MLRAIEHKIEALVEGVFGRAFRTNVQPVELARKLAKEMDDHRMVSVSRVYVPNEYTVYLSPADHEQFSSYEDSVRLELGEYLAEHARREGYVMHTTPVVLIATDADLAVGEFGISTRMVQREPRRREGGTPVAAEVGATMVYREQAAPAGAEDPGATSRAAALRAGDTRHPLENRQVVIGRAQECDIRLSDPNVSRRHAEIRQEGPAYWVVDLESTNGTEVNGRRAARARLENGDRITIGSTELVFERSVLDEIEKA